MSFFAFRRKKDPSRNYMNRMVIGLGAGLVKARDAILNPDFGPQGAMDILATWMGQELAKELLNQKVITATSKPEVVLEKLMEELRIAEDLSIEMDGDTAHVVVQNCLVCPRRVGGYDLEGHTSCPVGGLVRGAIGLVSGKTPQLDLVDLKTGEICKTDFTLK